MKEIIKFCIENKTDTFSEVKFKSLTFKNKTDHFIFDKKSKTYKLNLLNGNGGTDIISIAEEKLNKKLPLEINEALKFVFEFEEEIKQPILNVSWAGILEIRESLYIHVLLKFQNELKFDLSNFFKVYLAEEFSKAKHLNQLETFFFKALPFFKIDIEKILEIIEFAKIKERISRHIYTFCQQLAKVKPELAIKLHDLIKKDEDYIIPSNILIGLYNNGNLSAFQKVTKLFDTAPLQTLFILGRINFSTIENINESLGLISKINIEDNTLLNNSIDVYSNILNSDIINDEIKKTCFDSLKNIYELENENIRGTIIYFLSYIVEKFEFERNEFLFFALSKTESKEYIKYYFTNFKDPKYFIELYQWFYNVTDGLIKMEYFEHGMSQFWGNNQAETEKYIFDFLSHESIFWRNAGLKLLRTAHLGIYQIDVLKLDTELKQLRCLEALYTNPYFIELSIPLLLTFRNSKFKKVKSELQIALSQLVFESYHDELFALIEKSIGISTKDKTFIKPIKAALDKYHKLVDKKNSINDLNPRENERGLMDLYFRLEHEKQAKMIESIKTGKGTFLEFLGKSAVIVRGHAWKLDGHSEVNPLGKIEHSTLLSAEAIKNPELFQAIINNPKSKN